MAYEVEYTDTFGGEANYCWVVRATVDMPDITHYGSDGSIGTGYAKARKSFDRELVRRAKQALGLSGVRCKRDDYGDMIRLTPRGTATTVFITWKDA
jgi:hypothetical protein